MQLLLPHRPPHLHHRPLPHNHCIHIKVMWRMLEKQPGSRLGLLSQATKPTQVGVGVGLGVSVGVGVGLGLGLGLLSQSTKPAQEG